jgi:copper(I)-binding protein
MPGMTKTILAALAAASFGLAAHAQVKVESAWARPTVAGQQGGGGYLTLTSPVADRLLGGHTPAAERIELHAMTMQGDVMQMRQVPAIELPAGRAVKLEPGGLHVMFLGLKQPLAAGSKLPVTLQFEKAGEVKVEFDVTPRPPAAGHPGHHHKH